MVVDDIVCVECPLPRTTGGAVGGITAVDESAELVYAVVDFFAAAALVIDFFDDFAAVVIGRADFAFVGDFATDVVAGFATVGELVIALVAGFAVVVELVSALVVGFSAVVEPVIALVPDFVAVVELGFIEVVELVIEVDDDFTAAELALEVAAGFAADVELVIDGFTGWSCSIACVRLGKSFSMSLFAAAFSVVAADWFGFVLTD